MYEHIFKLMKVTDGSSAFVWDLALSANEGVEIQCCSLDVRGVTYTK